METSMPSVLIETGFSLNMKEEGYLARRQGQDAIAAGIFRRLKSTKWKWSQ